MYLEEYKKVAAISLQYANSQGIESFYRPEEYYVKTVQIYVHHSIPLGKPQKNWSFFSATKNKYRFLRL